MAAKKARVILDCVMSSTTRRETEGSDLPSVLSDYSSVVVSRIASSLGKDTDKLMQVQQTSHLAGQRTGAFAL